MESADEIYQSYIAPIEKKMMRAIYRIVQDPDDAADAFQNALIKIWKYLPRIVVHPNPSGYILSICISSAYDSLRKHKRRRQKEVPLTPELEGISVTENGDELRKEQLHAVQQCLSSMPLQQAQAVLLRLFEEQTFSSIGAALQCTEATARSHVSKGLARLRVILSGREILSTKENQR